MKAVLQRVKKAKVLINDIEERSIDFGIVVLLGIDNNDNKEDVDWLVKKVVNMRIFNDKSDVMNLSLIDINGSIMIISQFTLIALTKKGNRPSWNNAASSKEGKYLYNKFIEEFKLLYNQKKIQTGIFGEDMKIELNNNGPVTIFFDSKN